MVVTLRGENVSIGEATAEFLVDFAGAAMDGNARAFLAASAAALAVKGASKIPDAMERFANAKSEKEKLQAIKLVRQTVLESADFSATVADLSRARKKAKDSGDEPVSGTPGCFVIATYKKLDFDKDLTDYIGVYVGHDENVAEGFRLAISKEGNPDVYADVKYKQNVHAFFFFCDAEQLEESYFHLAQAFSGEESYN